MCCHYYFFQSSELSADDMKLKNFFKEVGLTLPLFLRRCIPKLIFSPAIKTVWYAYFWASYGFYEITSMWNFHIMKSSCFSDKHMSVEFHFCFCENEKRLYDFIDSVYIKIYCRNNVFTEKTRCKKFFAYLKCYSIKQLYCILD